MQLVRILSFEEIRENPESENENINLRYHHEKSHTQHTHTHTQTYKPTKASFHYIMKVTAETFSKQ